MNPITTRQRLQLALLLVLTCSFSILPGSASAEQTIPSISASSSSGGYTVGCSVAAFSPTSSTKNEVPWVNISSAALAILSAFIAGAFANCTKRMEIKSRFREKKFEGLLVLSKELTLSTLTANRDALTSIRHTILEAHIIATRWIDALYDAAPARPHFDRAKELAEAWKLKAIKVPQKHRERIACGADRFLGVLNWLWSDAYEDGTNYRRDEDVCADAYEKIRNAIADPQAALDSWEVKLDRERERILEVARGASDEAAVLDLSA